MSPLWRDQIQLFLAPYRIDWVHWKRGFKPIQQAKATVFYEPESDSLIWDTVRPQFAAILTEAPGCELSIVLSNHFVRYVALPPQIEITTPEEVKSYAEFRMREIYTDKVDDWELSVSDWNPMEGAICAAVSRDLMAKFTQMASDHRCKIKMIEPYLASVYDRWHNQLKGDKVYIALLETGRFCLAITHQGKWQVVRNQRISHDAANELVAALDQEVIWSGAKEPAEFVYLFAPEHPELILPQDSGWHIITLPAGNLPALTHYPSSVKSDQQHQCPA